MSRKSHGEDNHCPVNGRMFPFAAASTVCSLADVNECIDATDATVMSCMLTITMFMDEVLGKEHGELNGWSGERAAEQGKKGRLVVLVVSTNHKISPERFVENVF